MTDVLTYVPLSEGWKAAYAQKILERIMHLQPLESLPPATRKSEAQRRALRPATQKARSLGR